MSAFDRRKAPSATPDLDDPGAPCFMDEPVRAADWAYRGYCCRVYREMTERDYPNDDRERFVAIVDDVIVRMTSDHPLEHNLEELIDVCEAWVDDQMSGWLTEN